MVQQNINLIPQTEVTAQQKKQAIKLSSVFAILILVVILGVSSYFFLNLSNIKKEITSLDNEIENYRAQVKGMSDVEIRARNLDKKYSALQNLMGSRPKYSKLLVEINARMTEGLRIDDMDVKPEKLNVSGTADNYVSIANFVNNLVDKEYLEGQEGLEALFTSVSLNSVNLEGGGESVKFFIVVEYDTSLLTN